MKYRSPLALLIKHAHKKGKGIMKEEKECGMIVCHGQFPGENGANCQVPHALN